MSDDGSSETRYRAPALDKGLDILEILAEQLTPLTRSEIVRELGLNPSQIYRMLERLVARGYVIRHEGGDRYSLSMKLFLLGTHYPPVRRLTAQAQPLMDEFSRKHRQSCHLVVPEGGFGVVLAQASLETHWQFRARVGAQMSLFNTGSGLTLLAFQHPDQLIKTLGQWGITDPETSVAPVAEELAHIRAQGFRRRPSRQAVGVTDISVPVLGPNGEAFGALTCAHLEHPDEERSSDQDAILASLFESSERMSFSMSGGAS